MKVTIKDFGVDLEVKSKGIEFEVRTPSGEHQGDLYLTSTSLIWCQGRTARENGKKVTWEKFRQWMTSGSP